MVNNFVLRNNQSYVNSMLNIIDHGADGYYQTVMFFDSSRNHIGNAVENIAEILIYPYCTTLSLKNLKAGDELVAYNFSGLGTEKSPYLIYNENEFSDKPTCSISLLSSSSEQFSFSVIFSFIVKLNSLKS